MKKNILKSVLYNSLLVAALSFTSCGKKEDANTDSTNETTEIETTETESSDPVMDTVVEKDGDTVVRTGGGKNENPTGEQVP